MASLLGAIVDRYIYTNLSFHLFITLFHFFFLCSVKDFHDFQSISLQLIRCNFVVTKYIFLKTEVF